jgi:hypothetical protein
MEIAAPAMWTWMWPNEIVTELAGTTNATEKGWQGRERWPMNVGSRKTNAVEMTVAVEWMT